MSNKIKGPFDLERHRIEQLQPFDLRPRQWRRLQDQVLAELLYCDRPPAGDDLDLAHLVLDPTGELVLFGQAVNEGSEPDPLHSSGDDDAHRVARYRRRIACGRNLRLGNV